MFCRARWDILDISMTACIASLTLKLSKYGTYLRYNKMVTFSPLVQYELFQITWYHCNLTPVVEGGKAVLSWDKSTVFSWFLKKRLKTRVIDVRFFVKSEMPFYWPWTVKRTFFFLYPPHCWRTSKVNWVQNVWSYWLYHCPAIVNLHWWKTNYVQHAKPTIYLLV